ncbi:tetratricopeptide repeat protein [Brachyspira pilosicoli]|uniref:tetratricopeptide repeat protein n=1 Tax=Brachyspira pilosicoli TaxID=52584 RepID=UPI0012F48640|nr:tetratricopeptide repeat protein [Brachyspira pilosicoli]
MSDNNNTENINNNTNNDKSNSKEKNECPLKIHFSFMLYSIICIIFLLVLICKYSKYTNESKALIENSIKQFELNSQTQLSNYYEFLKETVTNESFESKEFIKNTLEEAFKPNIDLLRETLKDSKDFSINTVTFWLAFLSLIMIIFTILGIYANNKIMESNQRQSELIIEKTEFESNQTLKELNEKAKGIEETLKKIEQQTKQSEINVKKSKLSELLSRALNEQMNKNYDEAIKLYTKALEIDSKNLMALNNRGNLYSDKYKETKDEEYFDKALDDYNKILNTDKNNNDINALNNRGILYSDKYRETKEEEYFNKSLKDYNKVLTIDKNYSSIYTNISFLYLIHYQIKENKESLKYAEIYINKGLEIAPNDMELLNNKGVLLYLQYKGNNDIKYLKESFEYLNKSIEKNTFKKDIGETYYYLHLVYDEYVKLDNNNIGYSKEECENKSKEYLKQSKDLGYKHFMNK